MPDPVQLFLIVRQNLNAMEKKPLCFRSILSISLKFQNDHPLALYDNKRLFDAKLDFRKTVVVGSAHSLQIRADQKSPR